MTVKCDKECKDRNGCVCEFEELKPTRDNVRACVKGFKVMKSMVDDELDLLEPLHSQYMAKKGRTARAKQFNAVRKALNDLLAGLREDRL